MIEIDGSHGEGGGQVLRSTLALSVMTGKPVQITNIRAGRPKPGLMPQHLKAVEAAGAISRARMAGAALGSQSLVFEPRTLVPGDYRFDIGTAGATALVLQTLAVPLSLARSVSRVTVTGGTHVPWSPSFPYLERHWRHYLGLAGYHIELSLQKAGFYPPGGGQISAVIHSAVSLKPLSFLERGPLLRIEGVSAVANLDASIARRQKDRAESRLRRHGVTVDIAIHREAAPSPGTYLLLLAEFRQSRWCYCALGARGKRAEKVADEAVDAFERFVAGRAPIDRYLADQLVLPLAVIPGTSSLAIEAVSLHLLTNVEVTRKFLPVDIDISGEIGAPGKIVIKGVDMHKE